jgi:hypothetical protein
MIRWPSTDGRTDLLDGSEHRPSWSVRTHAVRIYLCTRFSMDGYRSMRVYLATDQHRAVMSVKGKRSWEVVVAEALDNWLRANRFVPQRTWQEDVEADIEAELGEPEAVVVETQQDVEADADLKDTPGSEGVVPSGAV